MMTRLLVAMMVLAITASVAEAKPRVARDDGPDLPYSCAVVRLHAWARGFKNPPTPAQKIEIAALEKEHKITPKQHRQAVACFPKVKKPKSRK